MAVSRRNKWFIGLAVFIALLVGARLALPAVVERVVNRQLNALNAYRGHVGDIDIHLWRGAYSINDIEIVKKGASRPVPFFKAARVNFSVEWPSLWKGRLVSQASFESPELNLVQGNSEQESQLGKEEKWNQRLEELFPFRFNTVQVVNGTVRFLAPGISTPDAITARHVQGRVTNLTNVVRSGKETFADFRIGADVLHQAPAKVSGSIDPFAKQPTFDVNLEVKKVQLPDVNPWLRQYLKADAEAGKFELYLEVAAADGKFRGYAKPIMQDVKFHRSDEQDESALRKLWEGFLDFAANVVKNHQADQVAARIPFQGTLEDPKVSVWETIASVLRNGFVAAFAHSLEGSITLRDVQKDLKGMDTMPGAKDEKKDKDKDKEKKEATAKNEPVKKGGPAGK
jgi:uncharacterized protein YhdP